MQRKRGELVPIGEALADLGGPVQALRETPPSARHHFTVADQVNQLVSASEADPDLGFMARLLALCSLPRTNPGNRLQYKRVNGPFKLIMSVTGDHKLPHGSNPRLILAWVCTEAVRTGSREIMLGRSLSDFMRKLGISSTDGRGQARLRNQIKRLFNCSVQLNYTAAGRETSATALVAELTDFWWNPKHPGQTGLWESKVRLSEVFFNEIVRRPVPLDMNTLKALKRSPLGPGSLLVAHLSNFCSDKVTAPHLASVVSAIRCRPGQSQRQSDRPQLPTSSCARVEEDQAGLAGVELLDGSGRPDPASLDARHPTTATASPRGIALNASFLAQGSLLTAARIAGVWGV